MRDCPVIESEGRAHPLDLRYLGRRAERRIEDEVAAAVRTALAEGEGGVLAFLPGVAEIERTAERLDGRSEEHTSELQSLMRISYAVFGLKTKKQTTPSNNQ